MALKTGNFINVLTLLIVYRTVAQETTTTSNFYTELLKRDSRRCQVYNGTVCAPFLTGKVVLTGDGNSISFHEKKLKKWFKQSKESGEISRECWPHAEALACMHVFQDCDPVSKKSTKPTLCSSHCRLMKQHICKGEYRRVIYSDYMQQFIPLCEEISFIDDSNGEFCYFLPTFNMSLGPEPYAESMKIVRKPAGKTAILKCGFGIRNFLWSDKNLASITDGTWYKGPRRIVWSKRMSPRTRQKGKARLFMTLKIRNVSKKDHGKYRCVISFANKTITNYAELSVHYPSVKSFGPVVVEKVESNRHTIPALANGNSLNNNDQQPAIEESMNGTCVPYGKGICQPFFHERIGTEYVFENANQRLDLVNKQLEEIINGLIKSDKLSARCIEFGRPVLCYNTFFRCQNASGRRTHSLCKRDCELFKNVYCKKELEMIAMEKGILSLYIPQCDELPHSDELCISISTDSNGNKQNEEELLKNAVHSQVTEMRCYDENSSINYMGSLSMSRNGKMCDNWNTHTHFEKINHAYCRNFGENKPWCFVNGIKEYCSIKPCPREVTDPKCYTGNGEYYGQQSISKSGRPCVTWNKVYQYSNLDHSYCRNYGKDRTEPWCYVDINTAESCGIPKCIAPEVTKGKVPLVAYIVPPVIVSSIIFISLILFIFYFRNKKILTSTSTPIKVSQEEVIDVAVVGTISTTASCEFKSESSVEEKSPLLVTKRIKRCRKNTPEVKEDHLVNLQKIGDGNKGQLWKGDYVKSRHLLIPVLVRKLRFDTASSVVSEFRQEMNQLRCLKHRNFQQVACVSAMSEVPFIAFECYHTQDLKEYLKVNVELSLQNIISYIYQICSGLDYLHGSKVIVRDLAARNCFISAENVVQISMCGLGMSRYPEDYRYLPALGLAPVRWLAPETLQTGIHSYTTDIYMLGVALWEIFSLGQQPFNDCLDEEIFILNREELLLSQPTDCPTHVWNIIKSCWSCPTSYRPCAGSMKQKFKHIHSKMKHAVEHTMT